MENSTLQSQDGQQEPKQEQGVTANDTAKQEPVSEPKQEPKADEPKDDNEVTDKHGQPGINREKYARDIEERDSQIAELRAQVETLTKTEEGRQEAMRRVEELERTIADDRLNFKLERAGCRNAKAAKVLLDDHEGDIQKLKEAEPWLFIEEKKGSTGFKPDGNTSAADDARINRALGLKEG